MTIFVCNSGGYVDVFNRTITGDRFRMQATMHQVIYYAAMQVGHVPKPTCKPKNPDPNP